MNLDDTLAEWIQKGGSLIGEIRVTRLDTGFELRHHSDENTPADNLRTISGLAEARELSSEAKSADCLRRLGFVRGSRPWLLR